MRRRVQKWGNSLGLRIPKGLAEETGLKHGSEVDMDAEDGRLVVTPVAPAAYTLEELVTGMTEDTVHDELDYGPMAGKEVW